MRDMNFYAVKFVFGRQIWRRSAGPYIDVDVFDLLREQLDCAN